MTTMLETNIFTLSSACFSSCQVLINLQELIISSCPSYFLRPYSSMLLFTIPLRNHWLISTNTPTLLTLFSPNVVIFSVWVVVGLGHGLCDRPVHRPSVQQQQPLPPWHHAPGCQLLGLLGDAAEFLGIGLLVSQHTGGGNETRRMSSRFT